MPHEPWESLRSQEEEGRQKGGRLQGGQAHVREPDQRVTQFGEKDHHRNNRQVLDDQDSQHHLARKSAHPSPAFQGLEGDHGAGEGDRRSEPKRRAEVQSGPATDEKAQENREKDLERGSQEGDLLDGFQILEREFQAQGEEQKGDPDLRQKVYLVGVGNGHASGVRAEEEARQDVAQNQRLSEPLEEKPHEEGPEHEKDDVSGYAHRRPLLEGRTRLNRECGGLRKGAPSSMIAHSFSDERECVEREGAAPAVPDHGPGKGNFTEPGRSGWAGALGASRPRMVIVGLFRIKTPNSESLSPI
ncbi:MAG: hypothetical protein BWY86_01112 [Candidatus Aminicenantes bacterium ADurb.Bin508]|nr:MAG: hypothetical protein BWY86_01112 [Candidatus Aminicenantes bacterium ADurb.Bin508]